MRQSLEMALGPWVSSLALHAAALGAFWHCSGVVGGSEQANPPALPGTTAATAARLAAAAETVPFWEDLPSPIAMPASPAPDEGPREVAVVVPRQDPWVPPRARPSAVQPLPEARAYLAALTRALPDSAMQPAADAPKHHALERATLPASVAIAPVAMPEPGRGDLPAEGLDRADDDASAGVEGADPELLQNQPPEYPAEAVRNGWEGTVVLRLQITAAGGVDEVTIASGSGYAVLDMAAVSAVKGWRFRPARRGSGNVAAVVRLPVIFELSAGPAVSRDATPVSK